MLNNIEQKDVCPIIFKVEALPTDNVKGWVYLINENDYDDASKSGEVLNYVTKVFYSDNDARRWLYRKYQRWQRKFPDATGIVTSRAIGIQRQSGTRVTMSIKKMPVW